MITPLVRMCADALADDTHGVMAQVTALVTAGALEDGDTAPSSVVIGDATRDREVALGRPAAAGAVPALSVFPLGFGQVLGVAQDRFRDFTAMIGIRFDVQTGDPETGTQWLALLVRGTIRTLQWWVDATDDTWRIRKNLQVITLNRIDGADFAPSTQSPDNTFALRIELQVRDTGP